MSLSNPELSALVEPRRVHRRVYTDPAVFDLEMERIWGKAWIYVGHESQIPGPGDYITLQIGKIPIVMVRDRSGGVHVLYNRCGHKGAKLVDNSCGNTGGGFVCCYHGWSYKLDGRLVGVPHLKGYENTGFDKNDPQYSMQKLEKHQSYRGFVFASRDRHAPELTTWLGGARTVLDNLCDRSPEGEVEVAGGVIRYDHQCNWKMFNENLNDAMHPMVVHRSVVDAANEYIRTLPEDSPSRAEAEIIPPFGSSYKTFSEVDILAFPYGHHYNRGQNTIHAKYSVDPDYETVMLEAYGPERTREILTFNSHNTLYYPSLTIKSSIQNIRVVRPVAADHCIIETWSFRLKGAPDSLLQRTILYSRLINSSGSMVGPDDLVAYRRMQEGLESNANQWVEMHRDYGRDETVGDHLVNRCTSDLDIRTQYRAWRRYMLGET
ncbi:aromatic ring-hydroxylating dioxygenase subunit alpha [Elongatibacter sediminis]|uniref:Aromatic ring-hydroxylating dioxygenase subunit alpha n=1 Tax=Elongatibacter sediminis TaxID=3119006 RepID=A0AAW9RH65_9GAMM